MLIRQWVDAVEQQDTLERPSLGVQRLVRRISARAGHLNDVLHGVPLGHPLHPAAVQVPLGAWLTGAALDVIGAVTGRREFLTGADASVALGLAGALVALPAGFNDWQYTLGRPRRLGLVHALINTSATLLQGLSLALRLAGARRAGSVLSGLTLAGLGVSAYLGSEMDLHHRIGADHTAGQRLPADWVPVLPEAELPENQPRQVLANGVPVLLVRQDGAIHALPATCTHLGGPLPQGTLGEGAITCPWHSTRFALADGRVLRGPGTYAERCLHTRVRDGQIEVGPAERLGHCRHESITEAPRESMPATRGE